MNISTLMLLRPGIAMHEKYNLYQGYNPSSVLDQESRSNAIELRSLSRNDPIDALFCVDTISAQETAQIIFEGVHEVRILSNELIETSYERNSPCSSAIREMGKNILNAMSDQVHPGARVALIGHQECLRSILFTLRQIHFGQATLIHFLDIKPCVPVRLSNVEKLYCSI